MIRAGASARRLRRALPVSPVPTLRFLRRFAWPAAVEERELLLPAASVEEARAATVYVPAGRARGAWILVHGVTVPGRHHAALRRMARALAAAGELVVVPEIEAWRALRVSPGETAGAVADALAAIDGWPGMERPRVGLMGFSVAATWALTVAAGPLAPRFRVVAGMGGYGSLDRTLAAMITGEHDWQGRRERYTPDPYGRWILGAELLPRLEGDRFGGPAERALAGEALRRLALTAGRHGAPAEAPAYDPLNAQLRAALPPGAHAAWDLLAAPSTGAASDVAAGRALASALAEAGRRVAPELDPAGRLAGVIAPVMLLHGRADRLIPCSETPRLAALLPRAVPRRVAITRLLGHTRASEAARPRNPFALAGEAWRFARFIHACLATRR